MPRKKMRIYRVAWSMILAGVPIHSNIGRDSKNADKDHRQAGNRRRQYGRMYPFMHTVGIPRPIAAGDHNVGAYGDTDEQIDQKIDQRGRRAYGRQSIAASIPANNDDVRCVEQQLQNARAHQRKCKQQNLLNSGPLHISISYVLFMEAFPLPSAKLAGRKIKSFPLPFSPFSSLGGSPHDHYSDLLSKDKIEFSTSFFLYAFLFCKREKARFFCAVPASAPAAALCDKNASSSKYFARCGHRVIHAWHLMQTPFTTAGSCRLIAPIGHTAAHSPQPRQRACSFWAWPLET